MKKKVKIARKELLKILQDNEHQAKQITELQTRGTEMLVQYREVKYQLELLREAVRYHRDQKGDNRCWVDDLRLYEALPEGPAGYDPTLPPEEVFLANCKRFCQSRQTPVGEPFKKDW